MRALKILVVVMGVMIVAGVAVLVAVIIGRAAKPGGGGGVRDFAAPAITIPPDARIEAIGTGTDRVVVALVLADGSRQLVIIELASGRKLGTIALQPEP